MPPKATARSMKRDKGRQPVKPGPSKNARRVDTHILVPIYGAVFSQIEYPYCVFWTVRFIQLLGKTVYLIGDYEHLICRSI
jgi:hypothetical protein